MTKDAERLEREERAARLRWARKNASFSGPQAVAEKFGFNVNNYKAHEAGRNGFSASVGDEYADAFGVSRKWLYLNIGSPEERDDVPAPQRVPLVGWVSAGLLMRDDIASEALGEINASDLPPGDWIALRVLGMSMDRISPPESVIFVDRRNKRLVPNGLYVIADEDGNASYKRYRPGPPARFEPVSTNQDLEPLFPTSEPIIIGRVRRTVLDT